MLEITAWSIVAVSFLLLGIFGYSSILRTSEDSPIAVGRVVLMIVAGIVSAFVLNGIASQIFMMIEINIINEFGSIYEDQMQPDMPNLMTGLIMFGWAFFLAGLIVARLSKEAADHHKTTRRAGQPATRPESDSEGGDKPQPDVGGALPVAGCHTSSFCLK